MTDTVISSATKEVVIGFERPFVIIGERINPTGKAERLLGWRPRVPLDEGMRRSEAWLREAGLLS